MCHSNVKLSGRATGVRDNPGSKGFLKVLLVPMYPSKRKLELTDLYKYMYDRIAIMPYP